ncbi:hypothetical protein PT282_05790 [Bifidobacterium sp. ESL0763]|uniref:hypothetical protein n=1 Tax=Bifidobacterium sp. ESL0763 TaxID=2983227 RepID=UPI0023F9B371|nr:hypothetical protein [Bifidobacterium sp. ESL0763]MDF7664171.1 hypothetical protein [Bifidobacterium sp. ESL0763]
MAQGRDDQQGRDGEEPDGDSGDGLHFSDADLEKAMEGFEKEFADEKRDEAAMADGDDGDDSSASGDGHADNASDGDAQSVAGAAEETLNFDEELQGLLGNRAKVAVLITRLASADLLAAFCQIADISADCLADESGAVAVLRNLDGDAPEAAAKDITRVVGGMPVVLAVNRADKLEATLYIGGEPGQHFSPPILFTATPAFVEDLMLGIADKAALAGQGKHIVDTGGLDRKKAIRIISEHVRFGRRGPQIQ